MIDYTEVVNALLPALGAGSTATLTFWTESELYEWGSEALRRLGRTVGMFIERDASVLLSAAQPYPAPARNVSVIHVSAADVAMLPANVQELDALAAVWSSTTGTPARWLSDVDQMGTIRLYPAPGPGATGNLAVVHHAFPTAVSSGAPTVNAPSPVQEYLTFAVLAEARGKESKGAMPEVAQYFRGAVSLLEDVMRGYWGGSQ